MFCSRLVDAVASPSQNFARCSRGAPRGLNRRGALRNVKSPIKIVHAGPRGALRLRAAGGLTFMHIFAKKTQKSGKKVADFLKAGLRSDRRRLGQLRHRDGSCLLNRVCQT